MTVRAIYYMKINGLIPAPAGVVKSLPRLMQMSHILVRLEDSWLLNTKVQMVEAQNVLFLRFFTPQTRLLPALLYVGSYPPR